MDLQDMGNNLQIIKIENGKILLEFSNKNGIGIFMKTLEGIENLLSKSNSKI